MRTGRKPKPTALRRHEGNPGKRGFNADEPVPPPGCPDCPPHLSRPAQEEWDRLGPELARMGVLTLADRAAFAAYCQAWARWVEAEERLKTLPAMVRTPNGHVQQNPWLAVANKQLELMGRYMTELGLTPASRSRITVPPSPEEVVPEPLEIQFVVIEPDGSRHEVGSKDKVGPRVTKGGVTSP